MIIEMKPQHKTAKIIMTMRGVTATRQKNCLTKDRYCLLVRLYVTVVFKTKSPSYPVGKRGSTLPSRFTVAVICTHYSTGHTLAFRLEISEVSSFVKAKHFQPRSFREAPIRYSARSSMMRNLS